MDAKLFSSRTFSVSGTRLFSILAFGMTAAAATLDGLAGRTIAQGMTLPLVTCTAISALVGCWAVPMLRNLKAGQVIREDGPKSHLKKAGTPTMGGAFFVPVGLLMALLWSGFNSQVLAVAALTGFYGLIGFLDDWQIIRKKSNKGISPRMKMFLQISGAVGFCLWMKFCLHPPSLTSVALPWLAVPLSLGGIFWLLAGFVLVAESNATNLTDGVDGLAGGTVAIALLGLGQIAGPENLGLTTFCACMAGACLGFLVHNRNPARVFMGDTGSLALGGALAAVGLTAGALFPLLILSGLFFWETVSVIIQVTYYKATKDSNGVGKRFFKMSPFHNHLELSGWTETQIVGWFYLVTAVLGIAAVLIHGM